MIATEIRDSSVESAPALVNVCMLCHQVIGSDNRPAGPYIPTRALVSHGVCLNCIPAYCDSLGLS